MEIQNEEREMMGEKQLSDQFKKLQQIVFNYQETLNDNGNQYEETVQKFLDIQHGIIHHGIFSPNEEVDEVSVQNLKFFLLPYYLGEVLGRISENRRTSILTSRTYLNEYIKLTDHYKILTKEHRKIWKNLQEDPKFEFSREQKIANFKEKQMLQAQLNNIESISDESTQREIYMTQINICIIKTLDTLKLIREELEILDYREKIEKDQETQEQHMKRMSQPLPQIKYIQIPKLDEKGNLPYLVNEYGANSGEIQGGHKDGHLCHVCYGTTMSEMRQKIKEKVWTPGISMPTMTLDEFADKEIERMRITEESNKQAAEAAKKEEEIDSDLDQEFESQKKQKERDWDDWKDAHEKGAGNKMR